MERAKWEEGTKQMTVPVAKGDHEVIRRLAFEWDCTQSKVVQALISEAVRARREAGNWGAPSDG